MPPDINPATALYPDLPSSAPAPAADQSVYGGAEGGLGVAREVQKKGIAAENTGATLSPEPTSPGTLNLEQLGLQADAPITAEFAKLAGDLKIDQAGAERLMQVQTQYAQSYWDARQNEWASQAETTFGADLPSMVSTIKSAFSDEMLFAPGFTQILSETRLGSHPVVIDTLHRLVRAARRR
jgi:hypothetical protein